MKSSLTLNKRELSQAVADFVAAKTGKQVRVDVTFNVSTQLDRFDRPIEQDITATATFSEDQP